MENNKPEDYPIFERKIRHYHLEDLIKKYKRDKRKMDIKINRLAELCKLNKTEPFLSSSSMKGLILHEHLNSMNINKNQRNEEIKILKSNLFEIQERIVKATHLIKEEENDRIRTNNISWINRFHYWFFG